MYFIPIIIIVVILIILSSKKNRTELERMIFLSGFEMIHDFKLIQNWTASDFPVTIKKFLGSLLKAKIYMATGKKNNKTYVIIKQVITAPFSFNAEYTYLEKSSVENFKKMVESAEM